jgi:hypothetical protein
LIEGETARVSGDYLEEVGEATAVGEVARIYDEIRATTGLPFVSLIYRHLATEPDVLERTWGALAPVLSSPEWRAAAAELADIQSPEVVAIPVSALSIAGLDADEFVATTTTLVAYARANSSNLLASQILLSGLRSTRASHPPAPRVPDRHPDVVESALLPMCDLRDLDGATVGLLEEISVYVSGEARPLVVPSLWRRFGHRPALIALLWTSMRPSVVDGSLDRHVDALLGRVRLLARDLAVDEAALDGQVASLIRPFVATIPRMLVCGAMMRSALREGAQLGQGANRSRRS